MAAIRPLDPYEIRVLGVLLEKEQTTPDAYPLTTNAVVAGCNQKSNRSPVLQLTETDVTETLDRLREDVLVWRSASARSERWEHRLDRRWHLDAPTKAVITLLLLRGSQTPGELRTRSARMHPFGSPNEVEAVLEARTSGPDALFRAQSRRPGQREVRWDHIVGTEAPADAVPEDDAEAAALAAEVAAQRVAGPSGATYAGRLDQLEQSLADVIAALDVLRAAHDALRTEHDALAEAHQALRIRLGDA
ncbi:MAG: DUF480 domain-containing protein [Acidobacteriota bacterium]